jgi:hypothetical protein
MFEFPSRLRFLLVAAALLAASRAFAADVYVISNGALSMTAEEVKEVFLGETQFSGSLKLLPVDNAGAQPDFLARVLKMPAPKYSAAWMKKAFRDGLNAPSQKASDVEVLMFVRNNPGAIGYVNSEPRGVHVVGKY